jgi:hypothetical protein
VSSCMSTASNFARQKIKLKMRMNNHDMFTVSFDEEGRQICAVNVVMHASGAINTKKINVHIHQRK